MSYKWILLFLALALISLFFVDYSLAPYLLEVKKKGHLMFKLLSFVIFPPFLLIGSLLLFGSMRLMFPHHRKSNLFIELALSQCLSVACVRILKVILGRARPDYFISNGIKGCFFFESGHYFHSFPSGHTMAVFAFCGTLSLFYPRCRTLFFSFALIFASSRVFLLDHFPSDLFATAALGLLITQMIHVLMQNLLNPQLGEKESEQIS